MFLGYNTNGFAHHRLDDAIVILAELGYRGVAIAIDYHALDPFDPHLEKQLQEVKQLLRKHQLRSVIETGARFLLDPRLKHSPTLVHPSAYQQPRIEFLIRAIDIASELESDAVSLWSGTPPDPVDQAMCLRRMLPPLRKLCKYARDKNVKIAFEPEPGMAIDTMTRFASLKKKMATHPNFGLTLDVGHLHCQREFPLREQIVPWVDCLWNLHIEDMIEGVHDHLMFGEGTMPFDEIFGALHEIDYQHGIFVELSRHSHNAVKSAQQAMEFLEPYIG
jgi:sugar phosphate isomerase/epimerase